MLAPGKQSEFAADLAAVDLGHASGDYANAEHFFGMTFLTEGLKRVLQTALERLTTSRLPISWTLRPCQTDTTIRSSSLLISPRDLLAASR